MELFRRIHGRILRHWQTALAISKLPKKKFQKMVLRRRILSSPIQQLSAKRIYRLIQSQFPAPNNIHCLFGTCNICGTSTAFCYDNKILYRESLFCVNCITQSRYRSIARGILRAIREMFSIEATSIAGLPIEGDRCLFIYDTQTPFYRFSSSYPIPDLLSRCNWIELHNSVYRVDKPLGFQLGKNLTNQDIQSLTFPQSMFDIVITSDLMEHVRLDDQAHREIQRILKPGGVYIFTVPNTRNQETLTRILVVDPKDPSHDQFLMEREFHGDPNLIDNYTIAYRTFGTDLDKKLEKLGFEVHFELLNIPELGIMETELFYCKLVNKKSHHS